MRKNILFILLSFSVMTLSAQNLQSGMSSKAIGGLNLHSLAKLIGMKENPKVPFDGNLGHYIGLELKYAKNDRYGFGLMGRFVNDGFLVEDGNFSADYRYKYLQFNPFIYYNLGRKLNIGFGPYLNYMTHTPNFPHHTFNWGVMGRAEYSFGRFSAHALYSVPLSPLYSNIFSVGPLPGRFSNAFSVGGGFRF